MKPVYKQCREFRPFEWKAKPLNNASLIVAFLSKEPTSPVMLLRLNGEDYGDVTLTTFSDNTGFDLSRQSSTL